MHIINNCHLKQGVASSETDSRSGQDNADPLPAQDRLAYPAGFASISAIDGLTLLWLLVISLCLAGIILLAKRKKELGRNNPNIWADAGALNNTLVLAVDQNAGLVAHRTGDEAGLPQPLNCLFLKFEPGSLIAQLNQTSLPVHELWTGFAVECTFFVDIGGQQFFFRFESKVLRISQDRDLCLIALACPKCLQPFERRRHDRVSPDGEQVLALGIWPIRAENLADLPSPDDKWESLDNANSGGLSDGIIWQHLPSEPSRLSGAPLVCCPGRQDDLRLADICASGLGVRIKRSQMHLLPENCLVLISLHSQSRPLTLWLACRRRHISAVRGLGTCVAGLDIRRWALYSGLEKAIDWKQPDNKNAANPLRNWVIKYRARERKKMTRFINL